LQMFRLLDSVFLHFIYDWIYFNYLRIPSLLTLSILS
jgi:hypothetical protein